MKTGLRNELTPIMFEILSIQKANVLIFKAKIYKIPIVSCVLCELCLKALNQIIL